LRVSAARPRSTANPACPGRFRPPPAQPGQSLGTTRARPWPATTVAQSPHDPLRRGAHAVRTPDPRSHPALRASRRDGAELPSDRPRRVTRWATCPALHRGRVSARLGKGRSTCGAPCRGSGSPRSLRRAPSPPHAARSSCRRRSRTPRIGRWPWPTPACGRTRPRGATIRSRSATTRCCSRTRSTGCWMRRAACSPWTRTATAFASTNDNELMAAFGIRLACQPVAADGHVVTEYVPHRVTAGLESVGVDFHHIGSASSRPASGSRCVKPLRRPRRAACAGAGCRANPSCPRA